MSGLYPKKEGTALRLQVARVYKRNGVTQLTEGGDETMGVREFETHPAHVSFGQSRTLNVGNYCTIKTDVRITVPCYVEEVQDAYETAKDFVQRRLGVEVDGLLKQHPHAEWKQE